MWHKIDNFFTKSELNLAYNGDNSKWSDKCGGNGGSSFQFNNPKHCLVSVRGKCGDNIDRIEFLFLDITQKEFVQSPPYGGLGGLEFLFQPPPGQWITKVYVWSQTLVFAIQFETNKGFKSPKYGGNAGKVQIIDATNKRICGVKGRSAQYIDQISFAVNS